MMKLIPKKKLATTVFCKQKNCVVYNDWWFKIYVTCNFIHLRYTFTHSKQKYKRDVASFWCFG